jgi:hypothetical protein
MAKENGLANATLHGDVVKYLKNQYGEQIGNDCIAYNLERQGDGSVTLTVKLVLHPNKENDNG